MSQNQPPVGHNISTVVFFHNREADHAPDLNVLFELTRDIPYLRLRRQDAIIAINKIDIRVVNDRVPAYLHNRPALDHF